MIDATTWWNPTGEGYADFMLGLNHVNAITFDKLVEYEYLHRAFVKFGLGMNFIPDRLASQENGPGEAATMRQFISEASESHLTERFYTGSAFRNLIEIEPPIYDVYKVRDMKKASPDAPDVEIIKRASTIHQNLRKSTDRFDERRNVLNRKKVGKDLGALLYLIRCNISHGHKMSLGGNNAAVIKRDQKVAELGLRVLHEITRKIFGEPQYRLAVYGTLRQSHSNHDQIADLGEPKTGVITGTLETLYDFPVLTWTHDGEDIPVEVYISNKLDENRWRALNAFEGNQYRRMLVPVRFEDGTFQVATAFCRLNPDMTLR